MDKLGFVADQLESIGIPYEFGEWTQGVQYPYFTGEITEDEPTTEDGRETSTLILTGWHRGKRLELETAKKKIKNHFNPVYGFSGETDEGSIHVFFGGSFYVPSGESELQKIQIELKIIEWKVE